MTTPRLFLSLPAAALLFAATLSPGCRVHSHAGPPRIVGTGLVRGHAALGIREEDQLLRLRVSLNPDRVVDFSLWKLLRLEVGLVGASVGVGPFDVGLGALLYGPDVPRMMTSDDDRHDEGEGDHEVWDDELWIDDGGDDGGDDGAPEPTPASEVGTDRWR